MVYVHCVSRSEIWLRQTFTQNFFHKGTSSPRQASPYERTSFYEASHSFHMDEAKWISLDKFEDVAEGRFYNGWYRGADYPFRKIDSPEAKQRHLGNRNEACRTDRRNPPIGGSEGVRSTNAVPYKLDKQIRGLEDLRVQSETLFPGMRRCGYLPQTIGGRQIAAVRYRVVTGNPPGGKTPRGLLHQYRPELIGMAGPEIHGRTKRLGDGLEHF